MKMTKFRSILATLLLCASLSSVALAKEDAFNSPVHAQSSAPPASTLAPQPSPLTDTPAVPTTSLSFFNTAKDYFTTFNTNLDTTFGIQRGEFAAGVDAIGGGGVNLANSLRISYNVYKKVSIESVTRDSGITGIFISQQIGPALNFVIHDAKLTLYAHGGYNFEHATQKSLYGEIGARVQKALTEHTFAGISIGLQFPNKARIFSAYTGFTF